MLNNVAFSDLQALMKYIYHGEVNIPREKLESFIKTGLNLQIKGLLDQCLPLEKSSRALELSDDVEVLETKPTQPKQCSLNSSRTIMNDKEITTKTPFKKLCPLTSSESKCNMEYIEESDFETNNIKMKESLAFENRKSFKENNPRNPFKCLNCGKAYAQNCSLLRHQKYECSKSGAVRQFTCKICSFKFQRPFHLKRHLERVHLKIKKDLNN